MDSALFSYRHAAPSAPKQLKLIRIYYIFGIIFFAIFGALIGLDIGDFDDAFHWHLFVGAILAPAFYGVILFYQYKRIKLSNPQQGIDIFSDHMVLYDQYHTFHIPIKGSTIKIEPTFHLKINNSGSIIIFSGGKHYKLYMKKNFDKFQKVLDQLKVENSTYVIPSTGVFILASAATLIISELEVKADDWLSLMIMMPAFLFLYYRLIPWFKSENRRQYREKFKMERRPLFRFSCFAAFFCYTINLFPLSLPIWKFTYASYLIDQHKYEQGYAVLEEIIKETPKSYFLNDYAWFLTTAQDTKARNYAKATHLAQIALEKAPKDVKVADTLACAYLANGEKEKALALAAEYKLDKRVEEFKSDTLCLREEDRLDNNSRDMASQKEKN